MLFHLDLETKKKLTEAVDKGRLVTQKAHCLPDSSLII